MLLTAECVRVRRERVNGELGRLSNDSNGFESLPVCDWKSRIRVLFLGGYGLDYKTSDGYPKATWFSLLFVVPSITLLTTYKFLKMFHLMPTPQASYYVLNDIFRLNYA
ncbi:hypothetical protein V8G54_004556 [Vigna mungo]|uniref:NTF2 domain-containing protein n=1 Tax=Vigna mungo TaxID=3915 RepID=A0AAQ3SD10_VIGMU